MIASINDQVDLPAAPFSTALIRKGPAAPGIDVAENSGYAERKLDLLCVIVTQSLGWVNDNSSLTR